MVDGPNAQEMYMYSLLDYYLTFWLVNFVVEELVE